MYACRKKTEILYELLRLEILQIDEWYLKVPRCIQILKRNSDLLRSRSISFIDGSVDYKSYHFRGDSRGIEVTYKAFGTWRTPQNHSQTGIRQKRLVSRSCWPSWIRCRSRSATLQRFEKFLQSHVRFGRAVAVRLRQILESLFDVHDADRDIAQACQLSEINPTKLSIPPEMFPVR